MTWPTLPLVLVTLLCLFVPLLWLRKHPRSRGEPFERMRIVMFALALLGAVIGVLNLVFSLLLP